VLLALILSLAFLFLHFKIYFPDSDEPDTERPEPIATEKSSRSSVLIGGFKSLPKLSIYPISDEHISLARRSAVAIRAENQFFAIRRKHGEPVEIIAVGNLLLICSI
jgi:hypothetical protein